MKTRVLLAWHHLRQSFWFVPSLITLLAGLLAPITLYLDETLSWGEIRGLTWMYTGSGAGASTLLSAIVGSMITATSVTFSMTLIALTLTTSQYGPRLLQNFMRRPGSQIVLGTFLATFIYSLLVLRAVRVDGGTAQVPHLSVTVAIILALGSVGVLIFFIHHVAKAIQADTVIGQVYDDLKASIDRMFPEQIGEGDGTPLPQSTPSMQTGAECDEDFEQDGFPIVAPSPGYLQAIDAEGLLKIAVTHNLVVRLRCRPGHFLIEGQVMATVRPKDKQSDEMQEALSDQLIIGLERTSEQDVEFAILQLVEVALRALSPGINDPHTAIRCLDWIAAALSRLSRRDSPSIYRYDEAGHLRVIAEHASFPGLVDAAYNQIRQASRGKPALLIRLLDSLSAIAVQATRPSSLETLQHHADMVLRECRASVTEFQDRLDTEQSHRRFTAVLARKGDI